VVWGGAAVPLYVERGFFLRHCRSKAVGLDKDYNFISLARVIGFDGPIINYMDGDLEVIFNKLVKDAKRDLKPKKVKKIKAKKQAKSTTEATKAALHFNLETS
jgi:acylphosphatase